MRSFIFLMSILIFSSVAAPVIAQDAPTTPNNSLCFITFEDRNADGDQSADEPPLPGINVNLALEDQTIIASHITGNLADPYCFRNLPPGTYRLSFAESANHRAVSQQREAVLELADGKKMTVKFGAQVENPLPLASDVALNANEGQLNTTTRILLGLLGAVVVMVFMIGFGAVVISLIS